MVCTAVRHAAVKTVPSVIQSMASVGVNLATMATTANTVSVLFLLLLFKPLSTAWLSVSTYILGACSRRFCNNDQWFKFQCVHEGSMDLSVERSVSVAPPTVIMWQGSASALSDWRGPIAQTVRICCEKIPLVIIFAKILYQSFFCTL